MKQGRIVILDQLYGRDCAALVEKGILQDLFVDCTDARPMPEAIYRAKAMRMLKGQNSVTLDLGNGQTGYLRQAKGISPGQVMLVQVATHAEKHKAVPVSEKILFKSRYCIVTLNAPGINVARSIRDDDERERILEIAHEEFGGTDDGHGLILRSQCEGVDGDALAEDIAAMWSVAQAVFKDGPNGPPELLYEAPAPSDRAWRDWVNPDPEEVISDPGGLENLGFDAAIDALLTPSARLGKDASLIIEPTSALVAIDVNTGGDFSVSAGLKANMAAVRDLPRQLRLRGLGGQIVVDFAPMPRKDRRTLEAALKAAFRADDTDTILAGWTPLGLFELQRKRARMPLAEALGK